MIHFNKAFHEINIYKPSSYWGGPHLWKPPILWTWPAVQDLSAAPLSRLASRRGKACNQKLRCMSGQSIYTIWLHAQQCSTFLIIAGVSQQLFQIFNSIMSYHYYESSWNMTCNMLFESCDPTGLVSSTIKFIGRPWEFIGCILYIYREREIHIYWKIFWCSSKYNKLHIMIVYPIVYLILSTGRFYDNVLWRYLLGLPWRCHQWLATEVSLSGTSGTARDRQADMWVWVNGWSPRKRWMALDGPIISILYPHKKINMDELL